RHDRVRQGIADQRPALEHEVGGKEGADRADQRTDPDGVDHVAVAERLEQQVDHSLSRAWWRSSPCAPYITSGRSSSLNTVSWRGSSSSCRPAPPKTKWRSTPPKACSRLSRVKTSAVGP